MSKQGGEVRREYNRTRPGTEYSTLSGREEEIRVGRSFRQERIFSINENEGAYLDYLNYLEGVDMVNEGNLLAMTHSDYRYWCNTPCGNYLRKYPEELG